LLKVLAIAGPLDAVCDRIFALRVTRLSTDIAWLGAISASLEIYFLISGFSDIGIGVGRVLGFRYQENFRRPYAADSMREFWRRWNVTLVTWLRDYLSLPVEGFEAPTVKKYLLTIAGFLVIGLWLRTTWHVVPWAIYISTWLAIEAMGFGARLARFPRSIRHVYVLLVVIVGWVGLRAAGPGPLLGYLEAMFGFAIVKSPASMDYLTPGFVAALISAVVFAGPLVGWISRWRVSVDAATASLLMMCAATGVFVWQAFLPVLRAIRPDAGARRRS
jgi:alginate O-acetyltransferase complex protein AlgI